MKKILVFLCALIFLPSNALADLSLSGEATEMVFQALTVNPSVPIVGQEARVTVTVYNRSTVEEQGLVQIFAGQGGEQIGINLPVVVPPRGVDSVTTSWKPMVTGVYYLNARIDPTSMGDDPTNNYFQLAVEVDSDTDHDGVGNMEDQDDDNDGLWDYEDPCPTDPTNTCNDIDNEDEGDDEDLEEEEEEEEAPVLYEPEADDTTKQSAVAPLTGELVEFSVGEDGLSEGDIVIWNFSDGYKYTGTTVQRSFGASGEYNVVRTVISEDGEIEKATYEFRIATGTYNFFGESWFWLILLLLLIVAGVLIYMHTQEKSAKKSNRSKRK